MLRSCIARPNCVNCHRLQVFGVDARDAGLVALERDGLAVTLDVAAGACEVVERRLGGKEPMRKRVPESGHFYLSRAQDISTCGLQTGRQACFPSRPGAAEHLHVDRSAVEAGPLRRARVVRSRTSLRTDVSAGDRGSRSLPSSLAQRTRSSRSRQVMRTRLGVSAPRRRARTRVAAARARAAALSCRAEPAPS
jgi:hypothetical protein